MKKFLAALLAVIMVVSLIPATVFAADAECTLSSDDHSKANCLLAGVEFTKVSEEEGKCGQDGYTMYLCECGTYFADDIVDKPDHTHAVGAKPVSERVEPTCGNWGYAAVYTCDNCGENYPEYKNANEKPAASDNAPANAIKKLPHTFDNEGSASYGTDCTKEKQTCLVCGTVAKNANRYTTHAINYNDPHAIVTLPGVCTEGVAVFKCTRKDCVGQETVKIQPTGHNTTDMKHYDEVPSVDCGTAGVKEHWVCRDCGAKYYYNEENEFVAATDADLVIEAEHLNPVIIDESTPVCGADGWITYKCRACNSKSWTVEYKAAAEHTTFEELMAHNELAKKDANDDIVEWEYEVYDFGCDGVVYYWNCHNPLCGSEEQNEIFDFDADIICDESCEYIVPGTKGHDLVTVNVPFAYHDEYTVDGAAAGDKYVFAYTLLLCKDPECTKKAGKPTGWEWVTEDEEPDADSEWFWLNVSVVVESDGNIYEMNEDELVKYTYIGVDNVRYNKISAKPINCTRYKHFYENDDTNRNVAATCSRTGLDSYVCSNNECRDYSERTVAKLTHIPNYTGAACGSYDLKCELCDTKIKSKNSWTHEIDRDDFIETIEVPNCQQAAGDYYGCLHCSGKVIENKVNYSYTTKYNSYEEARLAHVLGDLDLLDSRAGNCYTVGKDEYKCSACSKYFWVYDVETTGKHIPDFSKVITEDELENVYNGVIPADAVVFYEEANCLHGAGYTTFDCARCDVTVEGAKPLDHNFNHADGKVSKKSATCTTTGNKEYYQCANECCYTLTTGADGEVVKNYVKYKKETVKSYPNGLLVEETVYTVYAGNSWFEGLKAHNSAKTHTVAASCTTAGFERYFCSICKVQEVKNVVAPTGHVMGELKEADPDCDTEGYIYYECDGTNCTGDDGIAGNEDDKIYTDEEIAYIIIPALGHINKSGRPIVDSCMDTESDRVCVREGCEYDGDPSSKKVPKSHKESAPRHFNATCTTPEYTLTVCENGCGKMNKVEHIGDALGHMFAWGVEAGLDYVDAKVLADKTKEFFADPDNKVSAYTAATYNENGSITFECARCKNNITMDVKQVGIAFSLSVDNASNPGAAYTYDTNGEINGITILDGNVIAVDIDMSAFETKVWGFNMDVEYQAASMKFLGYKFHASEKFANFKVNNILADDFYNEDLNGDGFPEVVYLAEDVFGTVKISAYTENAIDGTLFDATVTGTEKVVTLYFQIQDIYEYTYAGVKYVDFNNTIFVELDNISVTNTEDEVAAYEDFFRSRVYNMMDSNLNGNFNITDVQNCVKIIKGQSDVEYLAACDANSDGVVNLIDLDLMNKFLVGEVDVYDIYNALSWNAPEGFVAG